MLTPDEINMLARDFIIDEFERGVPLAQVSARMKDTPGFENHTFEDVVDVAVRVGEMVDELIVDWMERA